MIPISGNAPRSRFVVLVVGGGGWWYYFQYQKYTSTSSVLVVPVGTSMIQHPR